MSSQDPFREQIAIYALGAIDDDDRRKLEAHLRRCPGCQAKLEHVLAAVNHLAPVVDPVQPSPETRRELLARVRADLASNESGRVKSLSHTAFFAHRWVPLLALAVTGVLAVLLGLMYTQLLAELGNRLAMEAIMRDPRANVRAIVPARAGEAAQGQLMAVPNDNRAVLVVYSMPPLPDDEMYELWLGHGTAMTPGGMFKVDENGDAMMLVNCGERVSSYDTLGVSVEPRTGGPAPHGPIILKAGF